VRADPADPGPAAHRRRKTHLIATTAPAQVVTWTEDDRLVRAEGWAELVLPEAAPGSPSFPVVAIHHPAHREPLLLATPLALAPQPVQAIYRDRWAVEQLPLAAKQRLGAARQFVQAPETCQQLLELALLAGGVLSYAAVMLPATPTGFWDRPPQPTPGRLRRVVARYHLPQDVPPPAATASKSRSD
jgi:hypothetical protein